MWEAMNEVGSAMETAREIKSMMHINDFDLQMQAMTICFVCFVSSTAKVIVPRAQACYQQVETLYQLDHPKCQINLHRVEAILFRYLQAYQVFLPH